MTRKIFTWIVAILLIAGLAGFVCYFFQGNGTHVKKGTTPVQRTPNHMDVVPDAVEADAMPSFAIANTPKPKPGELHTVRIVSEEENNASSAYYVDPVGKNNLTEIMVARLLNPGEFENVSRQSINLAPVNDFAEKLNWPLLWVVGMPAGALEVRVWIIEGSNIVVYRLMRHDNEWTGFYAHDNYKHIDLCDDGMWKTNKANPPIPIFALTPRSGWENLWTKLKALGILTFPDTNLFHNMDFVLDGSCYIIEINDEGRYRSYPYNDLEHLEYPKAKQMMEIPKTLREEFQQSMPKQAG